MSYDGLRPTDDKTPISKLISFDIDGTLEVGDPPGCVTMDMVRMAKSLGYIIGSCSDRTISNQTNLWAENGIAVDFVSLKHNLSDVMERFKAEEYYHVGDTDMDLHYAERAGFLFVYIDNALARLWELNGNG